MKLKFHTGARPRIALAVVLAAASSAAFAQATHGGSRPGTVAAAQSQSSAMDGTAPSARGTAGRLPPPSMGPRAPRPAGIEPGVGPSPSSLSPQAPLMQADGRLRPQVIQPAQTAGIDDGSAGLPLSMPGNSMPGSMPGSYPATGMTPSPVSTGMHNPFAPASVQPAAQLPVPTAPSGKAQKAAAAKAKAKAAEKESAEDAPHINLQCVTPEIKSQGTFVGKIQNRYVYKYKSQYCFDTQP